MTTPQNFKDKGETPSLLASTASFLTTAQIKDDSPILSVHFSAFIILGRSLDVVSK